MPLTSMVSPNISAMTDGLGSLPPGADQLPAVLLVDVRVPEAARRAGEALRHPGRVEGIDVRANENLVLDDDGEFTNRCSPRTLLSMNSGSPCLFMARSKLSR